MPERGTVALVRTRVMGWERAWEVRMRELIVVVKVDGIEVGRLVMGVGVKIVRGGLVLVMWVKRLERVWRLSSWWGWVSWGSW